VDAIDLLQFHWPDNDTGTPVEESWGELLRLVTEGKIRAAGVCNFDETLLERCEAVGHVESLQTPFSLITRDSAGGLLQWCQRHDTRVIVYSPMQIGLLTDSFTAARIESLAPEDWRRRHPEFQSPRLERNLALRDLLRPLAEARSTTVGAVAVAMDACLPQVTGAPSAPALHGAGRRLIDGASIVLNEGELETTLWPSQTQAPAVARPGP
jgi:aryl-alcohol dehydrogenase-like predicted oxidoreductase